MHTITDCPKCKKDFMYHSTDIHLFQATAFDSSEPICQDCYENLSPSQNKSLSFEQKCNLFENKDMFQKSQSKTPLSEIPIKFGFCSSSHHPEDTSTTVCTDDIVSWFKFYKNDWRRVPLNFSEDQFISFIKVCKSDDEIEYLFNLIADK